MCFDYFPEKHLKCDIYRVDINKDPNTSITKRTYGLIYSDIDIMHLNNLNKMDISRGMQNQNFGGSDFDFAFRLGEDIQKGDKIIVHYRNGEDMTFFAGQPYETIFQIEAKMTTEEVT